MIFVFRGTEYIIKPVPARQLFKEQSRILSVNVITWFYVCQTDTIKSYLVPKYATSTLEQKVYQ